MRKSRRASPASTMSMRRRASAFAERAGVQHARFNLPAFPTTTIGSFPQTAEVRNARAAHAKGALTRRRLQDVPAGPDGARRALAGRHRPRRARAWRVRAQRHGAVFWRAARRLRLHHPRLGAILRIALRSPAGPVRRRLAAEADDGRVVAIRPVADEEADEGDADRARHHPELVVRPRRHSAQRGLPADRARDPRRSHRP